jgi:uncharacterized protein (DUF427 family)
MKAIWNQTVIAESNETIVVEGNHYFPPQTVKIKYIVPSETHTYCPWKGEASYYHIKVNDEVNIDAAWYYPETKEAANMIRKYIAFWKGVEVTE